MRKFLFYSGVALVLIFGLCLGAAYFLLDADQLAATLASQVEARTGLPVELDRAELTLFPLPAAELSGVRVGEVAKPLIEADAIRVSVSPLPLLFGKIAISSLELDRPRILVPTNSRGELDLPTPPSPPKSESTDESDEESASGLGIAVSRYSINDGSLRYQDWQLENVNANGGVSLGGGLSLGLDADVKDVGLLRGVEISVDDIRAEQKAWTASGRALSLQLDALRRRFQPELEAQLGGTGELDFDVKPGASRINLNLDAAQINIPGVFQKPDNAKLRIEAQPPALATGSPDGPVTVTMGSDTLSGTLKGQNFKLAATTLDLAELTRWLANESVPKRGQIEIAALDVGFSPLSVTGDASLKAIEIPVAQGTVVLSGPLRASGSSLEVRPLSIQVGGQTATGAASYDLGNSRVGIELGTQALNLESVVTALRGGDYTVGGTMDSALKLNGPASINGLRGAGTLDLVDGRIKGVSFVRAIFGKLADIGMLVAAVKGKDLSRYEEEEFQKLSGDYEIRDGKVHFNKLVIEYEFTTADLKGSLAIADGALDLSGKIILSEELQDELTGETSRVEKDVIPIAGIGCNVRKPCINLDGRAVASVVGTLAGGGELRDKLEEKIGKEGVDLLEQLLRGGGQP